MNSTDDMYKSAVCVVQHTVGQFIYIYIKIVLEKHGSRTPRSKTRCA